MNLIETLELIKKLFQTEGIRTALIGGLAVGAYGYNRATNDIDLLVETTDFGKCRSLLKGVGWSEFHSSNSVLQMSGEHDIDFIGVSSELGKRMLVDAVSFPNFPLPIVRAEDLIGLKIQAYKNNPTRRFQDLADIQAILEANSQLDKNRIQQLAEVFDEWNTIQSLF